MNPRCSTCGGSRRFHGAEWKPVTMTGRAGLGRPWCQGVTASGFPFIGSLRLGQVRIFWQLVLRRVAGRLPAGSWPRRSFAVRMGHSSLWPLVSPSGWVTLLCVFAGAPSARPAALANGDHGVEGDDSTTGKWLPRCAGGTVRQTPGEAPRRRADPGAGLSAGVRTARPPPRGSASCAKSGVDCIRYPLNACRRPTQKVGPF